MAPRKTTPKATEAKEPNDSADQQAAEAPATDEPNLEAYEQHRLDVLARLPEEKDRPKNIYARLAQINGFVGLIRKTGYNDFHRYTFAKESDLVEEVRPMLSEYGIWIEQSLVSDADGPGLVPHQRLGIWKSRDSVTVDSLTAITKRFRFAWWNPDGYREGYWPADSETPRPAGVLETTEWVYFMGYGDDTGDKGYYKAETGAVKYFLMKTFMIATGNDPEADRKTDERAQAREAGGGPAPVRRAEGRGGAAAPGGRQNQTSAPQGRQIGELLRAAGISSTTAAITKLEALTGDKVEPVKGEEDDLAAALSAYITNLSGPKAGAIIKSLREEASKPRDNSSQPTDTAAAAETENRPKAAGWVDENGGDDEQGPWSTRDGVTPTETKTDDAADDGSIDNKIE